MGFQYNSVFRAWANRSRQGLFVRQVQEQMEPLRKEVLEEIRNYLEAHDVNYNGDYSDSFDAEIIERFGGVQSILQLDVSSDADYAPFIKYGTKGKENQPHPKALTEWVMQRLGFKKSEAFPIARAIFRKGMQSSPNSNLRKLPPENQKGFDVLLGLQQEGTLDKLAKEYAESLERVVREIYNP